MKHLRSILVILAVVSVVCSGATAGAETTTATTATTTGTTTTATPTPSTTTTNTTPTNATTTPSTTTAGDCQPSDMGPSMQTVRLHMQETEIRPNETGHVTGAIQGGIANECPVKVEITLQLPDGVEADGGQNVRSDGDGFTSEFVVEPGELREVSADVRSDDLGQKIVRASVTYFPVGHPDMSKQMSGMRLDFNVTEEPDSKALSDNSTTATTTNPDTEGGGVGIPGFSPVSAVAGLALAALLLANRNGSDN